jgi:hypothetical protein
MQTLVEDFLPSLRHERGRAAGNKRRDAEAAEIRRGGTNRKFLERGIYAASTSKPNGAPHFIQRIRTFLR